MIEKKRASRLDFHRSETSAEGASIDAENLGHHELNELILKGFIDGAKEICVRNVMGQRYIGVNLLSGGFLGLRVVLYGYPGNCLANFNNGLDFDVFGNVADDVGDTMHSGRVAIHGDARDVVGQALQGGEIFVRGDIGNRAAIQMREYAERKPFLVVGGSADDYFGEYMAGGMAVVLGLGTGDREESPLVGRFAGTGMVGGKILIRSRVRSDSVGLPPQREDVLTYLDSLRLDGMLSESMHGLIVKQKSVDYDLLRRTLPASLFGKIRKFFVSSHAEHLATDYRALNSDESKELGPRLLDYSKCFGFDNEVYEELVASKFTIIEPEHNVRPSDKASSEEAED